MIEIIKKGEFETASQDTDICEKGCGRRYCPSCHKYLDEETYDESAFHCGDGDGYLLCPECEKKKEMGK